MIQLVPTYCKLNLYMYDGCIAKHMFIHSSVSQDSVVIVEGLGPVSI